MMALISLSMQVKKRRHSGLCFLTCAIREIDKSRCKVSGAKGYMQSVDGFGIEKAKCHKKSWTIVDGKKKDFVYPM